MWGRTGSVPGCSTLSFTSADGDRQVTLAVNTSLSRSLGKADDAAVKAFSAALCKK